MWWRRRDPPLDDEIVSGIIAKLMSIDAKIDRLIEELLGGEEEMDT